ncbi:hypothetical protein [Actinacidiphila acididurans]|uniref:YopA central domain-containing protein n=1 Tax=Actinacidiphila acididurans TaxID=2784346 RepID=A0ABS2U4C2_9ACTN|nr:hypothetical protein [Actinacidiphila acididurans]MBM9510460.1 hypothetical protein [Actinacidiphila acididurans]
MEIRRPYGDVTLAVGVRGRFDGWTNGAVLGNPAAPLQRIIAHWFNVPRFSGQHDLAERTSQGDRLWTGGRWVHEVSGWKITIDVRPDHKDVWDDLNRANVYVMTHVMEIVRGDGAAFTATQADPVLKALHAGVSFGLGRWVAPFLPVGLDSHNNLVWEEWAARHCDPARQNSGGWWNALDSEGLATLLDALIPTFSDPARVEPLWLQISYAIAATHDTGFVEQRVMIGAAGLEHVMWERLVLNGQLSESQYHRRSAHSLLREVLTNAGIDRSIDDKALPALAKLAERRHQEFGAQMDGPDVTTWVRNKLVHPSGSQDAIYRIPGVVTETWLLTRHYLTLLILESLGYRGPYAHLAKLNRWVGEVEDVPWA